MAPKTKTAPKKAPAAKPGKAKSSAPAKKGAPTSKAKAQPLRAEGPGTAASRERLTAPIPETTLIPHNRIRPSELNPRKSVREGYIEELAESLKATGQMQNISVRLIGGTPNTSKAKAQAPADEGGGAAPSNPHYEIIYGEQRWQAFRLLIERGDLPADHPMLCRVMIVDDAQHLELAILENQAREDVHPLEQAEAYARLAEIRSQEAGDEAAATRIIADRTGQSIRNIQFYVQVATRLSPEAKAAWRDGIIRNRKIAIELARWPHEVQNDAIESGETEDESDPARLRRWLEHDAPPVSAARFALEDYTAAGGVIVPGEDGGEDRLANKGLAGRLQREWVEAEVARISETKGYGLKPAAAESSWDVDRHPWVKPAKGTPKSVQGVRFFISPYSMEVTIKHPLTNAKTAAVATIQAALTDKPGETPIEDLPQPYARRNWMAGATARTRVIRQEIVQQDRSAALAVALMALLPKDGWTETFCGLRWDNATGDAAEVSRAAGPAAYEALTVLRGAAGFTEEGEIDPDEMDAAMATLLSFPLERLLDMFAELIANHSVDARATIVPGAKTEARALADRAGAAFGDDLSGLCTASWLKDYTVPQLLALAEDSGAGEAMRAAGKPLTANKSYLAATLPDYIPQAYVPPEARLLTQKDAEHAAAAMLARKAPS